MAILVETPELHVGLYLSDFNFVDLTDQCE